jgi:hypothetical protein
MNRRKTVKDLVLASGGLITLPFWMSGCRSHDKDSLVHTTSFSPAEQTTLAVITDTIIPAGAAIGGPAANRIGSSSGSIGALSLGIDKFLQKMIDDCYEQPVKDNIKKQLQALDESAKATFSKSFTACTPPQRQQLLLKKAASPDKNEKDFFDLVKSETIRGFNTSQQVMEGYLNYKIAPGHYYGCININ